MPSLPADFGPHVARILDSVNDTEGFLTDREARFLALLAATPTCDGEILEIGTYRGRSTSILSQAAQLSGSGKVVAIDPLPNIEPMAVDLQGQRTARALLEQNLRRCDVADHVELHQEYSYNVAPSWDRPLRLLWIDGDHSYQGAKTDFDLFASHLSDGAIVAMHDVLHLDEGPIKVFVEDVLGSEHFGPAGVCGSIGWAQYFDNPDRAKQFAPRKNQLQKRLRPLIPIAAGGPRPQAISRLQYAYRRWRVPHGDVEPGTWVSQVA